jgi:N-acetylated-alpha-linked acidic dipeptidase
MVQAPLTYAHYGRVEDFHMLRSLSINVTGTVVLAWYGKIFQGDIVKKRSGCRGRCGVGVQ